MVQAVGRAGAAKETAPAPPACSRLLACPAVLQGLFVPPEGRLLGPQGQTAHTSRSSLDDGRAPTIGSSKSSKIYGSICRTNWQTMAMQRERRVQEAAFCAAWQGRHGSTPRISFVCLKRPSGMLRLRQHAAAPQRLVGLLLPSGQWPLLHTDLLSVTRVGRTADTSGQFKGDVLALEVACCC